MTFAGRLESWCVAQEKTTLPDYPSQDTGGGILPMAGAACQASKAETGVIPSGSKKETICPPAPSISSSQDGWRRRTLLLWPHFSVAARTSSPAFLAAAWTRRQAGNQSATCRVLSRSTRPSIRVSGLRTTRSENGSRYPIRPASSILLHPLTSAPFWDPTNGPSSTRSIQHQPAASCGRFKERRIAALPRDTTPFTTARIRIDPRSVITLLIRWQRSNGRLYREYPLKRKGSNRSHRTHGGVSDG